jgi:hypothetical protein
VNVAAFAPVTSAYLQASTTLLGNAPESVWMLVWGIALLVLAYGARSMMRRAVAPPTGMSAAVKTNAVTAPSGWRKALVAKLLVDRARAANLAD